jgi:hypothetical protein
LDSAARTAGQLTRSFGSPADHFGNLVKRRAEQIVKYERKPLGGIETVEHDEQCETDRIRQDCFLFGIDRFRDDGCRRYIRCVRGERLFAARRARAKHVETHARDDGRQPAAKIFDRAGIGAAETQPSLLHRIVGLTGRTEHSVRDSSQVPAILFEFFCQPILSCHISSLPFVMVVTEQTDTL